MSQHVSVQPVPPERGGDSRGSSPGSTSPAEPSRPSLSAGRLAWLDVLRGVAVLFVVFDHLSTHVLRVPRHVIMPWFDTGKYG